ncbi:syntaxin-binding protein 5 [Elysia marginata]|uniref:Syntaxin-binding protein 5 n=1 Tax=Elysia marginata TaxID=1093978 RepID=A0AAV4J5S3_9GAST|nr:syntaxin-binding protein 5 [Elysia marginata]
MSDVAAHPSLQSNVCSGAPGDDRHSPRATLAPHLPRDHRPVMKTTSLTLAASEVSHSTLAKTASLGLPEAAVPATEINHVPCLNKKVPPPRPPPPKLSPKNSIAEKNAPEPLNPFDEDYFKAEPDPESSEAPVAPPRLKQKNKQQKPLVHQPALDVPLSPNSILNPVSSAGVTALAPVISLPRSASEVTEITKGTAAMSCENPELLSPSINLKPKSTSTGSLPITQRRHSGAAIVEPSDMSRLKELASKTMSDPKQAARDSDIVDLRKSSSDSNILSAEMPRADFVGHASHETWLHKKIHKRSKKKHKPDQEGKTEDHSVAVSLTKNTTVDDAEGRSNPNSDCGSGNNTDTDKKPLDHTEHEEMLDNFDAKESLKEAAAPKTPSSNKNFFSRVSLKIKALGGRKSSNEDDDSGPLSAGYWSSQKSQERQSKVKIEVLDLCDDSARKHNMQKMYLSEVLQSRKIGDKTDSSSFSRSRSSSMSSLDNVTREAIQCLVFADSFTRKQDTETSPCLWVGTSLGSVIVIVLVLQPDQRLSQPVIVSPSGSLYRLKGAIVCMSFLDFKGSLIPSLSEQWRDTRDNKDMSERASKASSRQMSVSTSKAKISPTSSTEINNDRQFAIICSEKQARAISLPSQTCAFKVKVTESSFVVRAEVVGMRDSVCLMCYVANGHILAFSLPSLKKLFDADFLPLTDYRVARTFCFSNTGHAMYLCSHTEIQKITYSAEISENLNEMLGELFLPKETPEAPKQGFLKSLFGGGVSTLDREELCEYLHEDT